MALHSCQSALLYYWAMVTREVITAGGGLAWLLWQEEVVNTVVELGVAGSLGVYRKEVMEGEHNK